ncbi:MAG: HAD hydrolase family protein [Candidatus Bathyarchaeia archaeon]
MFVTDCEGPISKNDNAFELTTHYVPNGAKLFTVISRYDDVLADLVKKSGYKAGDTLKLILPFLKAYGVTSRKMRSFSASKLLLIADAKETLDHVKSIAPSFIVSTSYEHYIYALCQKTSFPYENTYSTKVNLEKYHVSEEEKRKLKRIAEEIAEMPILEIPFNAERLSDLSKQSQETIKRLDEIFWKEIACTDCGRIFSEVNPVGGKEKAEALKDIAKKQNAVFKEMMYVGDSITDQEALALVKANGGLAVSFNGNQYAIKNAEIAIMSKTSIATAIIADLFIKEGKTLAMEIAENWNRETLSKSPVDKLLLKRLLNLQSLPKVKIITSENMESLAKSSTEFRKTVRGEAIGRLG